MRSLGWVGSNLIWHDWYLYKKKKFGHRHAQATEERPCEDTARRWPSASQGERLQDRPNLLALWSWTSSLQKCEKINFCCLTIIRKDTCTPMFTAALFTIANTWKQCKCPSIDECIKKMWYIYTMEYYLAIKKNEIMSFAAKWMDLGIIILSEVSPTKTNIIWHHLYVESKKMIQMNLFTKQKQTHRLWKQIYGFQREKRGEEG